MNHTTDLTSRTSRSIRRIVASSLVTVAATAALSGPAFAGAGDIAAPDTPPPPPEQPEIAGIPACVVPGPNDFGIGFANQGGIAVHLSVNYSDDADTCDATIEFRTYSLPSADAPLDDPAVSLLGEESVSVHTVEQNWLDNGEMTGAVLPMGVCHTEARITLDGQFVDSYRFDTECAPDEPGDEPDDEPGDVPADRPGDEPGDRPHDGRLPETGSATAPLLDIAAMLGGLGAAATALSRRRPAPVR